MLNAPMAFGRPRAPRTRPSGVGVRLSKIADHSGHI